MSADSLVEQFEVMKPAITVNVMWQLEKLYEEAGTTEMVNRRLMLMMLTKSGEELIEVALAEPAAMFDLYECSVGTVAYYSDLGHMLDAAQDRLMIALCGIDTSGPDAPFTIEQFDKAIDDARSAKAWGKSEEELSVMAAGDSPTETDSTQ